MNDLCMVKGVQGYTDENGTVFLNLENVALGLGLVKRETKNGKEYSRLNKQGLVNWFISFGILDSENDDLPKYIPENIFYKLCFKASNEIARKFQDVVTDEILPAIRKTGSYLVAPRSLKEALLLAYEQQVEIERIEAEKEILEIAIDESLSWCKFNKINGLEWDLEECKNVGKRLTGFCKARGFEVRKCEDDGGKYGTTNRYPMTAWDAFMEVYRC